MLGLFKDLDRILRGDATRIANLQEGTIRMPLAGISFVMLLLGAIYGLCMSTYGLVNRGEFVPQQVIATMIKVPALFYLTLLVTFPSLYVFNALVGSRLSIIATYKLIIASLAVALAVLASFGPIVAFFSFTTKSYSFMILLNVILYTVAGVLGLAFLLQTLQRLTTAHDIALPADPELVDDPGDEDTVPASARPSAIDRMNGQALSRHVKAVFKVWILVFGLVGVQMAWVLRPFLGDPELPFSWFRARESNFFQAVWFHLTQLF